MLAITKDPSIQAAANQRMAAAGHLPGVAPAGKTADGSAQPTKHGYAWRDEKPVAHVEVDLPPDITAKDVVCSIQPDTISLRVGQAPPVFDTGTLFQRVVPAECKWDLVTEEAAQGAAAGQRKLKLTLVKQKPMRWLGVTRG